MLCVIFIIGCSIFSFLTRATCMSNVLWQGALKTLSLSPSSLLANFCDTQATVSSSVWLCDDNMQTNLMHYTAHTYTATMPPESKNVCPINLGVLRPNKVQLLSRQYYAIF